MSNGQAINDKAIQSFYDKNNHMSFISKKTEKIVTAVYMVTDFMPVSEPLKIELRTLSVNLLSRIRSVARKATEPDYGMIEDCKNISEDISSLLGLAITIGLLSEMNGNILQNELSKNSKELIGLYNVRRVSVSTHPGYANIILNQNMFHVGPVEIPKIVTQENKGHEDKGQQNSYIVPVKKAENIEVKKENISKTNTLGIKIARRNDVLNIVKAKGQVSIKDIVLMLKDISEKTVQRELLSLVKEGVLKKEGEKRWSVYKLV